MLASLLHERERAAELRRRDGSQTSVLDVVFVLAAEVRVGEDLRGCVDQIGPRGEASCKINTTSVKFPTRILK